VELQIKNKEILSVNLEAVPLRFSNQKTIQKLLEMATSTGVAEFYFSGHKISFKFKMKLK
jgi:hypothetical protein